MTFMLDPDYTNSKEPGHVDLIKRADFKCITGIVAQSWGHMWSRTQKKADIAIFRLLYLE